MAPHEKASFLSVEISKVLRQHSMQLLCRDFLATRIPCPVRTLTRPILCSDQSDKKSAVPRRASNEQSGGRSRCIFQNVAVHCGKRFGTPNPTRNSSRALPRVNGAFEHAVALANQINSSTSHGSRISLALELSL